MKTWISKFCEECTELFNKCALCTQTLERLPGAEASTVSRWRSWIHAQASPLIHDRQWFGRFAHLSTKHLWCWSGGIRGCIHLGTIFARHQVRYKMPHSTIIFRRLEVILNYLIDFAQFSSTGTSCNHNNVKSLPATWPSTIKTDR